MKQVSVEDEETRLRRLVDEVEHGETITITRNGRAVARLVPVRRRKRTVEEAVEAMLEFGDKHTLGEGVTVRDLIEDGRRY
jgi:prevent-host-death family protein